MINGREVVSIGENALSNCNNITTISIPLGIQSILYYAFWGCDNLEAIVFKGTIEEWKSIEIHPEAISVTNLICSDGNTITGRVKYLNDPMIEYQWIEDTKTYSVRIRDWISERYQDNYITVYYTTDGTEPTKDSNILDDSIILEEGTEIKLIAIYDYDESQFTTYSEEIPIVPSFTRGPAGGWVVYDKGEYSDGWRYLEVAPYDMTVENGRPILEGSSNWPKFFLMGYSKDLDSGEIEYFNTSTAIGTGYENTQKIYSMMGDAAYTSLESNETTDQYAARLVSLLEYGGYDDWFIPSRDEWECVRSAIGVYGEGNFNQNFFYWGSTEYQYGDGNIGFPAVTPMQSYNNGSGTRANSYGAVRPMRRY